MSDRTNWTAMQAAKMLSADKKTSIRGNPGGVRTRYMTGGSWCASLSKNGQCTRKLKGNSGHGVSK